MTTITELAEAIAAASGANPSSEAVRLLADALLRQELNADLRAVTALLQPLRVLH